MLLDQALEGAKLRQALPAPRVRRLLREQAGLSQADVAAVLGVAEPTVSRWESGRRYPRRPALDNYAQLLERLRKEIAISN
jgi:transcriptional regulator with XRE-family HTH domain